MVAPSPGGSEPGSHSPLSRDQAESLARSLRIIADPTRLQLLSMILDSPHGEAAVGDLAERIALRQPTVTHHLSLMADEGLVVRERRGKNVWYSVAEDRRAEIADLLT